MAEKINAYTSIADTQIAEFKDRGSRFIAYSYPFSALHLLKPILEQLKKEHLKAVHFCYAFRMGTNGLKYRANDDGEPAGSAGKPILGQIDSMELTDVLVVVVRYFGGTLFEAFYIRGQVDEYQRVLDQYGMEYAEISDGSVDMPSDVKCEFIQKLSKITIYLFTLFFFK